MLLSGYSYACFDFFLICRNERHAISGFVVLVFSVSINNANIMARTSELGGVMASSSVDVILGKRAAVTSKMKIVGYVIRTA